MIKRIVFPGLLCLVFFSGCSQTEAVLRETVTDVLRQIDKFQPTPCQDGDAAGFSCDQIDLVAFMPATAIGSKFTPKTGDARNAINDMWGWYDEETGKEYALIGRNDATAFVDVTNPYLPVYLGELPLTEGAEPSDWRDIKVYKNHAYVVADNAGNHGMQIFDLTQLRNVTSPPEVFKATAHYDGVASSHNIVINEQTGFAYIVGSGAGGQTCGGGLHMVDIRQPAEPVFAGCFADSRTGSTGTGYTHDAQCVSYRGPDSDYSGKEVCFSANENALSIADVTDKRNPEPISVARYPKHAYTHQGWLTEDHRYYFLNDELDEMSGLVPSTRTLIWDVTDLEDPRLVKEYSLGTEAIDHNMYVRDNYLYQSNYYSGLRVFDITDPENPKPAGFFDTVPESDELGFDGSWSNYPYFRSGVIGISSMNQGFFLVKRKLMEL